jgi:hypothetical protein
VKPGPEIVQLQPASLTCPDSGEDQRVERVPEVGRRKEGDKNYLNLIQNFFRNMSTVYSLLALEKSLFCIMST